MERTPRGETESVTAVTEIILSLSLFFLSPLFSLNLFFSFIYTPDFHPRSFRQTIDRDIGLRPRETKRRF